MKKIQTILAYYSFIIATGSFFWSLFVSHDAGGFVMALLVFPVSIYFWVLVSGKMPREHDADTQHADAQHGEHARPHTQQLIHPGLLISLVLSVSTASMVAYITLVEPQTNSSIDKKISRIQTSISNMETDVSTLKKNARSIDKLDTKLTLIQSSLLKIDNKSDSSLLDDALQGILGTETATPTATVTPVTSPRP